LGGRVNHTTMEVHEHINMDKFLAENLPNCHVLKFTNDGVTHLAVVALKIFWPPIVSKGFQKKG